MSDQPSTPDNPNQERLRRIAARQQRLRAMFPLPQRVRVLPRDDSVRSAMRHPHGNIAFPKSGSVEWPLDRFTKRRLLDGSVTREEADKPEAADVTGNAHHPHAPHRPARAAQHPSTEQ